MTRREWWLTPVYSRLTFCWMYLLAYVVTRSVGALLDVWTGGAS